MSVFDVATDPVAETALSARTPGAVGASHDRQPPGQPPAPPGPPDELPRPCSRPPCAHFVRFGRCSLRSRSWSCWWRGVVGLLVRVGVVGGVVLVSWFGSCAVRCRVVVWLWSLVWSGRCGGRFVVGSLSGRVRFVAGLVVVAGCRVCGACCGVGCRFVSGLRLVVGRSGFAGSVSRVGRVDDAGLRGLMSGSFQVATPSSSRRLHANSDRACEGGRRAGRVEVKHLMSCTRGRGE